MAKNKRKNYHAVTKGNKTSVYDSWSDCKEQVDGYSKNNYKGFKTKAEAQGYIQKHSDTNNTASPSSQDSSIPTVCYSACTTTTEESPHKRIRRENYSYGTNDSKRTQSTTTSGSTNSRTPTESGSYEYDYYHGAGDDEDPIQDYYHSHGFYGFS
ncbi:MAG: hypothetical protein SGBAC_004129 [Bacillariaceae sp.]